MSETKYGFYSEEYSNGESIDTLGTGDGKTTFTDMVHEDGTVGVGFAYGLGQGVGVITDYPEGTHATDIGIQWQVKFESVESVESLIATLERVKLRMSVLDES